MSRNTPVLYVVMLLSTFALILALGGCAPRSKPTVAPQPTPTDDVAAAAEQPSPTAELPTPVPPATRTPLPTEALVPTAEPTGEPSPTVEEDPTDAQPAQEVSKGDAPDLLDPPDFYESRVIDLVWSWAPGLGPDEWFELYVWPDSKEAEPQVFGWYKGSPIRITASNLLPGRYRWKVVVVEGRSLDRGEETSAHSEVWHFAILQPSTPAEVSKPRTPVPTCTPSDTPTRTPRPWWPRPTSTPTVSPTMQDVTPSPTVDQPTNTFTPDGYPNETVTETPDRPTSTFTPDDYPQETNTPDIPAATATEDATPSETTQPTQEPTVEMTNTPAPKVTNTPIPPQPTPEDTPGYP